MKYNTIKYFSTVNGDGVRTAVFVSGCNIHCPGCFNKKAQDFDYGKPLDDEVIERVLTSIDKPYISGLSILGGEPLDERNLQGVNYLIDKFRERFGDSKTIWMWSGFYFDDLNSSQLDVVKKVDVLVDGPFIEKEFRKMPYRGSLNQHIIRLRG